MNHKISFVLPALNEENAIGLVLDEINQVRKELELKGHSSEVIIVDGKSNDNTVEIAKSKGAKVILSEKGYGQQYNLGFEHATGEIIVTGDTDLTYPLEDVSYLINFLVGKNLDFITTNRFAYMDKNAMSLTHKIGNLILTGCTMGLFFINIKDSQSGMWIFKRGILRRFNLKSKGMPFSQEIKIEAFKKCKAKELPIRYRERIGEVKLNTFKDGFGNLFHLVKKRFEFTM
jgi:glycosyltransferase involved in cell wall biosynthesis